MVVSRNRIGRYDLVAWDADQEAPSPWSDDQATTCYLPEELPAAPGGLYGVPPLPERFTRAPLAAATAPLPEDTGGFDDEPTMWLEPSASWDAMPPRASGVARRHEMERQLTAAAGYASEDLEYEQSFEDWDAPHGPEAHAWGAGSDVSSEHSDAVAVSDHSEQNPWQDEPNFHASELGQLHALEPGMWLHRAEHAGHAADVEPARPAPPSAAHTQRQRPQRMAPPGRAASQPMAASERNPARGAAGALPSLRNGTLPGSGAYRVNATGARPALPDAEALYEAAHRQAAVPSTRAPRRTLDSRYYIDQPPALAEASFAQTTTTPSRRATQDTRQLTRGAAEQRRRPVAPCSAPAAFEDPNGHAFASAQRAQSGRASGPRSAHASIEEPVDHAFARAQPSHRRPVAPRSTHAAFEDPNGHAFASAQRARSGRALAPRSTPAAIEERFDHAFARAQPTQRRRAPELQRVDAAFDELIDNPFARRRSPHSSWLLSTLLSCGAVAGLYFGGYLDRLSGMLHTEQPPVLRAVPLAPVQPQPMAAPAEALTPVAVVEPPLQPTAAVTPARYSWRKRQAGDVHSQPRRRAAAASPREEPEDERDSVSDQAPTSTATRTAELEELNPEGPAAEATLRINSRPWSQVFVDGKLVGNTPLLALRVSAGRHDIRLANPELDVSKSFQVVAQAGETLSRVELLSE